jgi:methylated-DNA-protein-cysteine methyltransferase-like protein
MTNNPYLEALSKIPRGETRSFFEIAALAGRPKGARAAGRAVSSCPADATIPWQRAVNAEGAFSIDPERAAVQLERLRAEGARPRAEESVERWARRVKAECVGSWKGRRFAARDDERVAQFPAQFVERFASAAQARERGFHPFDDAKGASAANGKPRKPARPARRARARA